MAHIEFRVTLSGYGKTIEEAWTDAIEGFSQDPGSPDDDEYKVMCENCDKVVVDPKDLVDSQLCYECQAEENQQRIKALKQADLSAAAPELLEIASTALNWWHADKSKFN